MELWSYGVMKLWKYEERGAGWIRGNEKAPEAPFDLSDLFVVLLCCVALLCLFCCVFFVVFSLLCLFCYVFFVVFVLLWFRDYFINVIFREAVKLPEMSL